MSANTQILHPADHEKWSESDKCPLNVCCSEFGFCGTTKDFCGNKTVTAPKCSGGSSSSKRTIGYFESWGITRGCDRMYPEGTLRDFESEQYLYC